MVTTDKAWRVNQSPRLSVSEFGEYMAADDGPRETILRDAKYERLPRSLGYRDVHQAASMFVASPTRDRRILADCRSQLVAEHDVAEGMRRTNFARQIEALDKFEAGLNMLGIAGIDAELPSNQSTAMMMEGVRISIVPTAWLIQRRPKGTDRKGALLVDLAKGMSLKTDAAKAKALNAMEHVACLLHMRVQDVRCGPGEKAANDLCVVHHLHRGDRVVAPSSYAKKVRNMEAVSRSIANAWATIKAPAAFDPSDAITRA